MRTHHGQQAQPVLVDKIRDATQSVQASESTQACMGQGDAGEGLAVHAILMRTGEQRTAHCHPPQQKAASPVGMGPRGFTAKQQKKVASPCEQVLPEDRPAHRERPAPWQGPRRDRAP